MDLTLVTHSRFGGSSAATEQRRASISVKLSTSHVSCYTLLFSSCSPVFFFSFLFFIILFFHPKNSHSFLASFPVAQHCNTSLASIIPGSDESTGREKKKK